MKYIEVKIYTTKEGIDPLTAILMDFGIAGFVVEEADDFKEFLDKKNSYDWDYVDESLMGLANVESNITFYMEENKENNDLLNIVRESLNKLKSKKNLSEFGNDVNFGRLSIETVIVNDESWKDNWKEYFKPTKITGKIVIKPTWESYEKTAEDEIIIEIDPGMAFGTGTHPTTTLCIRLLEKYIEVTDVVLDVGCGSGILAIAAALIGVKQVKAVDIDPVAVEVAQENIALNNLTSLIHVVEGDLTKGLNFKADIVVANLMADLVMLLSDDIAKHLKGKSIYISSGILIEKKVMVAEAIRKCGFEIVEILEEDQWCAIVGRFAYE